MKKKKLTIMFLAALCLSLSLTGCKDAEKEKAIAEAEEAKAKLATVSIALEKAGNEKKALEAEMTTISETLKKSNLELDNVTQARDQLNEQVIKLQEQIEQLQVSIEQLKNQLKEKAEEVINSKLYGIVFTTGWREDMKSPTNDLEEISINEKLLYVFCKWRLSLKDHTYTIKIFDESKQIIYEKKNDLKPTESTWNTWPGYHINKYLDKPGRWTAEVYLDGRKVGEKSINVLPEAKAVSSNSD